MPTATNMAQLQKMLQDQMKKAMTVVNAKVEADMFKEMGEFYSQGNPTIYVRTGALGNTPKTTQISGGGNQISFDAYLETPSYEVPNPAFISKGYASYYSGEQVLSAAESHSSHILGKGGFWSRTLKDIKTDLTDTMAQFFS